MGLGNYSEFDYYELNRAPLRQRLEWSLADLRATIEEEKFQSWKWILKPSVTNKGVRDRLELVCTLASKYSFI